MGNEKDKTPTEPSLASLDIKQLEKDLTQLQQQAIAISGAIQYVQQKIRQLSKSDEKE